MKIFITGIAGFLGSHLADWFIARGHEVAGCDNLFSGEQANVPEQAWFYHHDITVMDGFATIMRGSDVVYHCAAAAYEGMSVFAPAFISHNIYTGSATTFSAAIKAGVRRIVNCSSMARYGAIAAPFRETDVCVPCDPYGIAKFGAEKLLANLAHVHGIEYVTAVPHNIYGPRQRYVDPYRNVASIMINRMLSGKQPIIYGDGMQKRSFSYIDDCVGCLGKMATGSEIVGEVVNIGPDEEFVTIYYLASLIAEKLRFELDPEYKPGRPQEVRYAVCSSDKARWLLGYKTKVFLSEGLSRLIGDIRLRGPKPFVYHFEPEFVTAKTPQTWTEKLF